MKRLMMLLFLCVPVAITSTSKASKKEKNKQEEIAWQRQYMPLSSSRSSFVYTVALALICGPVFMIQPVVHPIDLMQVPAQNNITPLKAYVYQRQMKKPDRIKNNMIQEKISKNPSHR